MWHKAVLKLDRKEVKITNLTAQDTLREITRVLLLVHLSAYSYEAAQILKYAILTKQCAVERWNALKL